MTPQEYWFIIQVNHKNIGKRGEKMQANLEIKKYLEENGITQIFISRKTGIEASKLSLALNGDRKLTLDEYALICGVLGVSADKFLKPRLPDQKGE